MNIKMVRYVLGRVILLEGAFLLLPLLVSFLYREEARLKWSFFISAALLFILGLLLSRTAPKNRRFYAKEGLVIVALAWLLLSALGSVPFVLSGSIPNPVDAFFETSSGFTTTGASVVTDVEALPHSILFWRSFTHLVGGMGVLVFALAIMPRSSQNVHLMRAEVPGPSFGKLMAKLSDTARILYVIYLAMTAALVVLLLLGGMNLFDSLLHAFGAAGTGGFGIKNTSVAYYDSSYLHMVLAVAMVLFGVNFNLYYFILLGKWRGALRSEELRYYLIFLFAATGIIFLTVANTYESVWICLRDVFFTVSSIMTTTGYSTANFDTWPVPAHYVLLLLMFVGACAGSTAGGLKVSRVVVLLKAAQQEIRKVFNPNRVASMRYENKPASPEFFQGVTNYFVVYMFVFAGLLFVTCFGTPDFLSAFSAVAATFNNIGPGLRVVGPTSNYSVLPQYTKLLLSFAMIAGRLEIFPILIVFAPSTWKRLHR